MSFNESAEQMVDGDVVFLNLGSPVAGSLDCDVELFAHKTAAFTGEGNGGHAELVSSDTGGKNVLCIAGGGNADEHVAGSAETPKLLSVHKDGIGVIGDGRHDCLLGGEVNACKRTLEFFSHKLADGTVGREASLHLVALGTFAKEALKKLADDVSGVGAGTAVAAAEDSAAVFVAFYDCVGCFIDDGQKGNQSGIFLAETADKLFFGEMLFHGYLPSFALSLK